MSKERNTNKLQRLQFIQVLVIVFAAVLASLFSGAWAASSALLGGLLAWLPAFVFAKKLFSKQGARAAKQILKNFYLGEVLKISLSVLLFAATFLLCRVQALAFFLTYIAVVMTHWFSPLLLIKQQKVG